MRRFFMKAAWFFCAACAALPLAGTSMVYGQTSSGCRSVDEESGRLLGFVRELVTTADSQSAGLRTKLGLVAMDSLNITLITDNKVCAKAVQGMNNALQTPNLIRRVDVVRVGTDFAVRDPDHPAGEWMPTMILDKKYAYKGEVLAP